MTGLTGAYVYDGGAIIDTNGRNVTIGQSLLAPTGSGVSSAGMDLASAGVSGGGYIDTPIVKITGDGIGATAVATIDAAGNLTGITMTNPGVNYTTATFALSGGGNGNTGFISVLPTFVPNASTGGLTKNGLGTLTLTGTNTYTGNTLINGGMLLAASTAALPGYLTAGMVQVGTGATVAANVGGAGQWLDTDVLALYNNATFTAGSFLGLDTTGGDFTYSNAIAGNIGFKKLGTNKLTLPTVNTYNGGTTINGGILSVASNANLGDAAGGLAFNGGKLAATGAVNMARAITISGTGNGIDTAGNIVTIGGAGDLTWGAGTFTVDGTAGGKLLINRTGGTAAITAGAILQINAGASVELTGAPPLPVSNFAEYRQQQRFVGLRHNTSSRWHSQRHRLDNANRQCGHDRHVDCPGFTGHRRWSHIYHRPGSRRPAFRRWNVDRGSRTVHIGNASAGRNGTGHLLASQPVRIKGKLLGRQFNCRPNKAINIL